MISPGGSVSQGWVLSRGPLGLSVGRKGLWAQVE